MAWGFSGTTRTATDKTSDTALDFTNATSNSGDINFVLIVVDNSGTDAPTVSSINKQAGETNNWVLLASWGSSLGAGAGTVGYIYGIETTVAWSLSPTVTLSAAVAAKAGWAMFGVTGGSLTIRGTAQTVEGTGAQSNTFSGANQPQTDDLVLGLGGGENNAAMSGDSDTTNGSWSGVGLFTTGGGGAANVSAIRQYKAVTATGDQTLDLTIPGDGGICGVVLQPAGGSTPKSGTDTGAGADTSTVAPAVTGTEIGGGADAATVSTAVAATDMGTAVDAASVEVVPTPVSGTDTGTGTDTASLAASAAGTDTATSADGASLTATTAAADTGAGTDASSVTVSIAAGDTAAAVDAATVDTGGGGPTPIAGSETATGTDTATLVAAGSAAETGAGTDAAAVAVGATAADTATALDSAVVTVTLTGTDTSTAADLASLAATVAAVEVAAAVDTAAVDTGDGAGTPTGGNLIVASETRRSTITSETRTTTIAADNRTV